ncbi:MAG TPA: DNA-processing protein DprA [Stellaceae bacterium]|nr:DNA-processing protein DprA [Stellaceae bacterium]
MSAPSRHLNPEERLDWLRLLRSENVGPLTFHQLLQRFGSAAAALEALPRAAQRGGRQRPIAIATRSEAERELAALAKIGARLIAWGEPEYPAALAVLEDAPPLLSVKGDIALLERRAIGIVGARNASANGRRFAREIATELGRAGLLVVSGLARGIDTAAHQGSLATGTMAVVAGGIDIVYPEENQGLYDAIGERGIAVAELPVGTEPKAKHFPRRNRIISGTALGVIVIEAALKSGSLITARFALEQGREVLAVPGSPLDPRCRGTNDLIRRGAALVESAEDVLTALAGQLSLPREQYRPTPPKDPASHGFAEEKDADRDRARLLEALGPSPVPVDELVRQCQLSAAIVATLLLELELAGRLERHPGHQVSLL